MSKDILAALYELRDLAENGEVPEPYSGICANLDTLRNITNFFYFGNYAFVDKAAKQWDYTTGSRISPVPGTLYKWKKLGLRYRLSLIDHLIEKVETGDWDFSLDEEEE